MVVGSEMVSLIGLTHGRWARGKRVNTIRCLRASSRHGVGTMEERREQENRATKLYDLMIGRGIRAEKAAGEIAKPGAAPGFGPGRTGITS